jgi:hypothetical protein
MLIFSPIQKIQISQKLVGYSFRKLLSVIYIVRVAS